MILRLYLYFLHKISYRFKDYAKMKSVIGRWKISLEQELNEIEEIKEVFLRYWEMTHIYGGASGTGTDYFNVSEEPHVCYGIVECYCFCFTASASCTVG